MDYQLIHALLLFSVSRELRSSKSSCFLLVGAWLIFAGILMFSGSIYLMTLNNLSWLWPATPVGGILLILGWSSIICEAVDKYFRD